MSDLSVRTAKVGTVVKEAADLYRLGRHEECRSLCQQILAQRPNHPHVLHLLGVLDIQRDALESAAVYFEQAQTQQEKNAEFHSNYGALLTRLKRLPEARRRLLRALELQPNLAEARANLARVLLAEGACEESLEEFARALALRPDLANAHAGAGVAYKQLGRYADAIVSLRRAIALKDEDPEVQCNLALVLLQVGAFREGWQQYEWRMRTKYWGKRTFRQPRWQGESLKKRTILIPCEQGLGDTIQFLRYLPELKKLGPKIVFECPAPLKNLLTGFPGVDLLIDWPRSSDVEGGVDCYVPLLSLPMHMQTSIDAIPAPVPYLSARLEKLEAWRKRLAGPKAKVGLVWAGNPANYMDRYRSCRLADFAPLAKLDGVQFYSLQKGPPAEQVASPPADLKVIDLSHLLTDFAETAAAIAALDLVISVDTSVAHLAGAMGRPVWNLLTFSSDWRWFVEREDSPWYPTMRLFRQQRCDDWAGVMHRVAKALAAWSAEGRPLRVLSPVLSLDEAFHCQQQGQHDRAEARCRSILREQPHNVVALQLLGGVLFQSGRLAEAAGAFAHAAAIRPGDSVIHFNLAVCLAQLGRLKEAETSYTHAVALDPRHAEAHFNLANLHRDGGRLADAIEHYEQALAVRPDYLKARVNLANAYRREARWHDAATHYRQILAVEPTRAKTHHALAVTLHLKGDLDAALAAARNAVALAGQTGEFQNSLGVILQELGRLDEALACFDRAIAVAPEYAEAMAHRAVCLRRLGLTAEADVSLRLAVSKAGSPSEASRVVAKLAVEEFGWLAEAEHLLRECLRHNASWPEAHVDLSAVHLFRGELRAAFAEWEWRAKVKSLALPALAQPRWDGRPAPDQTLLLMGEQGFGDMIQFARYVPQAAQRVGRVVIACPKSLVRLFAALPGVAAAADTGEAIADFDVYAPMLSLPHVLETTLENLPTQVPYLKAPEEARLTLPEFVGAKQKIGIAWSGNVKNSRNVLRLCPLALWADLLASPRVAFYSLQVGERAADIEQFKDAKPTLIDLSGELSDWAETALALMQLDLVITVDTGLAHLAGALGKQVWILLSHVPDARWMLENDSCPWYPTMRVFRQKRLGDWADVLDRVRTALSNRMAEIG